MTKLNPTLRQATRALAIAILVGSSFLGLTASAAEPAQTQESSQAAPADSPATTATRSEVDAYAAREQQKAADALTNFQGGDTVVVIGGTTLGIILLVVLILVLI